MKGNEEKMKSYCDVSTSQEIFLQTCGFAEPGVAVSPDFSDPSVHGSSPSESPPRSSDLVESHAVRLVSPPESPTTTVDSLLDRTAPVDSVPSEKSGNPSSSSSKKRKVPLRDIVEAIVMNTRRAEKGEEEEREKKEFKSCVQILIEKGFKFP